MMTSGMHRRPFEGRHLVLEWIIKKFSYKRRDYESVDKKAYLRLYISYKRRDYESVDKKSLSYSMSLKTTKKEFRR